MGHYDAYGPGFYDAIWEKAEDRSHDYFWWVIQELKALPGDVLDVGCGDGELVRAMHFAKMDTSRMTGLDFSQKALNRYGLWGGKTILGTVENIPAADKSFPVVLALEVLEHLEDPLVGWNEIKRVCSGTVLLTIPPMMDIPQHKTVLDIPMWASILGLNRPPDFKAGQQAGWKIDQTR